MGFRSDLRPYLDEAHTILRGEAIDNAGWSAWLEQTVLSFSDHSESSEAGDLAATDLNEPEDRPEAPPAAIVLPDLDADASVEIPAEEPDTGPDKATEPEPEPEEQAPILGTLPPPSTDEVARPLAVAGGTLTEEDTECTADPDTVDEPTEEVTKEVKAQIDEDADRWDRMLGLDLKADDKLDKEWIRAARGESEHQRFVVWGALAIFVGILGVWKSGIFSGPAAPAEVPPKTAPVTEPPVEPTPEPELPAEPEPGSDAPVDVPEVQEPVPVE